MEDIGNLMQGFAVALTWKNLLFMLVGILLGVLIGVLPGLGGANGVAILLPLTFSMSPTSAIIMLSCIYWGALFGGAITSILFNIPGEPWSVATTFDGYPMAQQGRAAEAMTAAFTSSFVGALFAVVMITFLAPLVAQVRAAIRAARILRRPVADVLQLRRHGARAADQDDRGDDARLCARCGRSRHRDRQLRMTFGSTSLLQGFDFLIAVIGLFGLGEILLTMEEGLAFKGKGGRINPKIVLQTWKLLPKFWATSLRAMPDRLLDGHYARRCDAGVVHELWHGEAHVEAADRSSARARSKASSRPKPRRTPPARARCCRC